MMRIIDEIYYAWCCLSERTRNAILAALVIAGFILTCHLDAVTPGAMYY